MNTRKGWTGLLRTVALAAAVLVHSSLTEVEARTPFHANPKHVRAPQQCTACHTGHRAADAQMLRGRVQEMVCSACHSAADIARWRLEDQAGSSGGLYARMPLSTFPKSQFSWQPIPPYSSAK